MVRPEACTIEELVELKAEASFAVLEASKEWDKKHRVLVDARLNESESSDILRKAESWLERIRAAGMYKAWREVKEKKCQDQ